MPTGTPNSGRRKVRGKKNVAAIEAVLQMIEVGTPVRFAVVAGGICRQTWHKWVKADPALKERVEVAVARAVTFAMTQVREAALTSWQAAAWYLERVHGFTQHTTQDVRVLENEDGDDIEFKVQFADGAAVPASVIDDEEEEAA